MELRREVLWTLGALVVFNVLLAFGVVGLLVRMGPAIGRILEENVYSIQATEEILAEFASVTDDDEPALAGIERARRRTNILAALERAKKNVTEPEERPVVKALEENIGAALAGDRSARRAVVAGCRRLIGINRQAMNRVDRAAQRLGTAGAWAAVLVGALSFALSVVVLRRLRRRVLLPLVELDAVLASARRGEGYRRCRPHDTPHEVAQVIRAVNLLLDERLPNAPRGGPEAAADPADAALVELLDRHPAGALVLDRGGRIVRAGSQALSHLAGSGGPTLRAALAEVAEAGGNVTGVQAIELRDGTGWLCLVAEVNR